MTLPWPPKALSPNARVHWSVRSKAAKAYRHDCQMLCLAAGLRAVKWDGPVHLWLTFYPPDKRHYDDDNIAARFKAGRDGLADALSINDNRFVSRPFLHTEVRKGGAVSVVIMQGPVA